MRNVSVANTQSNVMVIAATQKTIRRSIKGMRGFNTQPRFKKQIYIYRLSFIHALYSLLAFRFLFAKNLPPAAFFHAKSPLRVRVPLIQTQNKKPHLAMELSILVRPKGLEPLTYWFVASHSIQLSYERKCSILNTRYILPHFMAFVKRFYKLFILF